MWTKLSGCSYFRDLADTAARACSVDIYGHIAAMADMIHLLVSWALPHAYHRFRAFRIEMHPDKSKWMSPAPLFCAVLQCCPFHNIHPKRWHCCALQRTDSRAKLGSEKDAHVQFLDCSMFSFILAFYSFSVF